MSMFKKLKGIFVVEDPNAPAPAETVEQESTATSGTTEVSTSSVIDSKPTSKSSSSNKSNTSSSSTKPNTPKNTKPDSKFVDILLKAIESNNQEGFDYLEYKQSLQSLGNVDMDETTRYQSALAMAKTMGATPTKLISSARMYIKVLDNEGAKFKQASANQRTKTVTGKEEEIKAHQKAIKEKEALIEKLTKEISQHKAQLQKTKATIESASSKVQMTTDKFMTAYNVVKAQILTDIANMEKFLK